MRVFRPPVYFVLLATWVVALATFYYDPNLLYLVTQEDGIVEWGTVAALLGLAAVVTRHLRSSQAELPGWAKAAGWLLVVLAILAAGEEISWGQRVFGFSTGETMQNLNLQKETNLHNLIPGPIFNGIIVFSLGIGFVLIPTIWRHRSENPPVWLPRPELSLLMLDAILINHYKFDSLPEQAGIVVIIGLLVWFSFSSVRSGQTALIVGSVAGWITLGVLYHCKAVLRLHNHQYEIRELLIVVLAAAWADQTLHAIKSLPLKR